MPKVVCGYGVKQCWNCGKVYPKWFKSCPNCRASNIRLRRFRK